MWKMFLNLMLEFFLLFFKKETKTQPKPEIELSSFNTKELRFEDKDELKIIEKFLPNTQYVNETTDKDFIVLHHTVGGDSSSTYAYWLGNKEKVATHFLVDRNGKITQCLPLENWAYHIYIASPGNRITKDFKRLGSEYDKRSIGIELCSLGPITLKNGVFYDIYKRAVSSEKVVKISYKGYQYWEKYTEQQIKSVELLLRFLIEKFPKIKDKLRPTNYSTFVNIQQSALEMKESIVFHTSLRTDKSDIFGQEEMIQMLNNLSNELSSSVP